MDPENRPLKLLRQVFGFESFRSHQNEIVDHLISGGDALVLMPTGGGKSLCYQIPAILRTGMGVVISPLIALMQDQVESLRQLGIESEFLNSTLSVDAQKAIEQKIKAGKIQLLYVAPERLSNPWFLRLLDVTPISLFAIDEAHCVSRWGHDFRADYLKLSLIHERFPDVPRVALTATADPQTRNEIIARLGLENSRVFLNSFDRPNIQYRVQPKQNPKKQLLGFIRDQEKRSSGIVYCLSRRKVDEIAHYLIEQGYKALPYHAGLDAERRAKNQTQFIREEGIIMVATIAFGMGIDKPDVRFVAHVDLPRSPEAYYQETGRAGRDGLPSIAWMVFGAQDALLHTQLIESSEGNESFKLNELAKLSSMLSYCDQTTCRRTALLGFLGEVHPGNCGNCDNCLNPPAVWDATRATQKALSCIFRAGQSYGTTHLIDILRGVKNERILDSGHQHLSTFSIGKDLSAEEWKTIFRQLIGLGFIRIDATQYGALKLTEACRPILKGEQTLYLRKDTAPRRDTLKEPSQSYGDSHSTLLDALKSLRRDLALLQNVPPYIIFQDTTLHEMCGLKPKTLKDLRRVPGVGDKKLERYGEIFLEAIRSYSAIESTGKP